MEQELRTIERQLSRWLRARAAAGQPIRAVVRRTPDRILVEMSDGRGFAMQHPPGTGYRSMLSAAVDWARRHGATTIEIHE